MKVVEVPEGHHAEADLLVVPLIAVPMIDVTVEEMIVARIVIVMIGAVITVIAATEDTEATIDVTAIVEAVVVLMTVIGELIYSHPICLFNKYTFFQPSSLLIFHIPSTRT